MADMSYVDKLATVGNMSDEDLSSFKQTVVEAFQTADANDDLDAMSAAADALEQISDVEQSRAGEVTNDVENLDGSTDSETGSDADAGQVSNTPLAASAADGDTDEGDEVDEPDDEESTDGDELDEDAEPEEQNNTVPDGEPTPDGGPGTVGGDAVTAAGKLPAALKNHEFKKKGAPSMDAENAADGGDDEKEEDDAVTASVKGDSLEDTVPVEQKDIPAERQPLVASASAPVVTAGADIPGTPAGHIYTDNRELSDAMVKRLDAFRGSRGSDGDKVIVASVRAEVTDPDRFLNDRDSSEVNGAKIDAVTRQMKQMTPGSPGIVASGGYCAPLEVRYDIFGVGVTDRPIRDSLAGFQATRGGIRYVAPPILSSFSSAVGLWTAANDANPSNPATKPFLTAVCQNALDVTLDAITLEIQFGNLMTRAFPELVARNNELGLIYQARFAEQTLLSKISAQSTAVTANWVLGTARDFLNSIGRLASAYRTRWRLNAEDALRVIAPSWVRDAIREDLTRGSIAGGEPGMGVEWADSLISAMLASRNVNITWHLDDSLYTGAQAAGPINEFPASIVYYLFAEGTFLFLDGGTLDLGIVRDSTLVGTNDYRMFVETFEGLAKVGIESIKATVTTHITGANYGTITPVSTPT